MAVTAEIVWLAKYELIASSTVEARLLERGGLDLDELVWTTDSTSFELELGLEGLLWISAFTTDLELDRLWDLDQRWLELDFWFGMALELDLRMTKADVTLTETVSFLGLTDEGSRF
uniref:Uncharacterized protein n=1 Tax=Acrobeloides nanus TaxID=290746 RepID=A0A914CSG0_9BILA